MNSEGLKKSIALAKKNAEVFRLENTAKKISLTDELRNSLYDIEEVLFPYWKKQNLNPYVELHKILTENGFTTTVEYLRLAIFRLRKEEKPMPSPRVEMPMAEKSGGTVAQADREEPRHIERGQELPMAIGQEQSPRKDGLMPWLVYKMNISNDKAILALRREKAITSWGAAEESIWFILSKIFDRNKALKLPKTNPNAFQPLQNEYTILNSYRINHGMPNELYNIEEIEMISKSEKFQSSH